MQILKIHTNKKPLGPSVDLDKLVELTDGFTGADIAALVNAAAISSVKERVMSTTKNTSKKGSDKHEKLKLQISMEHFEAAMQKIKRRIVH